MDTHLLIIRRGQGRRRTGAPRLSRRFPFTSRRTCRHQLRLRLHAGVCRCSLSAVVACRVQCRPLTVVRIATLPGNDAARSEKSHHDNHVHV